MMVSRNILATPDRRASGPIVGGSDQHEKCLQAFSELQVKMIDTQQKVKLADLQIEQLTRVQKHANLTHTEIKTLPDNTPLYEGVGRMFILQSKEDIARQLKDKQKSAEEKIKELEKKVYLERSVKEAEDNIREMLLSRRAQ
uniref:prefoldin subunit 1 isoform X2 n=1 Tax=Doryrhamphus excisus TaxID=161450 RepID=UPI0025AE6083|nr:prefoldin subunit 1 isoform X2 [Doryrhamphus excisus]